jgi:hypothetical protein
VYAPPVVTKEPTFPASLEQKAARLGIDLHAEVHPEQTPLPRPIRAPRPDGISNEESMRLARIRGGAKAAENKRRKKYEGTFN